MSTPTETTAPPPVAPTVKGKRSPQVIAMWILGVAFVVTNPALITGVCWAITQPWITGPALAAIAFNRYMDRRNTKTTR